MSCSAARHLLAILLTGAVAAAQSTPWTFVSIPDFQNNDVASLADPNSVFPNHPTLPAGFVALNPAWDSCTANYDDAVDWIVSRLALEGPEFVTVAGDLVMGHWEYSSDGRQVFGALGDDSQVRAAIDRAADYYYDIWRGRFDPARNTHLAAALQSLGRPLQPLEVHAVVGDHELGDNNWSAGGVKSRMVGTYKQAFARWHTRLPFGPGAATPRYPNRPVGTVYEHTAYAFQRGGLLMVVVDEFRQDRPGSSLGPNGSVLSTVDDGLPGSTTDDQLSWLDAVLAAGRADPSVKFIIVQGHMPVLRPVRTRNTSNLGVRDLDGTTEYDTLLWQTLSRHRVDAYFCGEVHDVTLSRYGGVTQIVHGALIGNHSPINYLVVDVHDDRLEFELREITVDLTSGSLWQTGRNRPRADLDIPATRRASGYATTGHAVLTREPGGGSRVTLATGRLAPYGTFDGGDGEYLVDMPLDALQNGAFPDLATSWNSGTPEGHATVVPGRIASAVRLDGNGDRVVTQSGPIGGAGERTVSVWAKTSAQDGLVTALTMGSNGTGSKWDVDIDAANGGRLELGVGAGRTVGQGPRVNDGAWHLLTTVLPAGSDRLGQVRLFVDGVFAYSNSVSANPTINTGGDALILGHAANSAFFQAFPGDLDDVGVWGVAFTDAMVRALHDVALAPELGYGVSAFEQLRGLHAGGVTDVTLGNRRWRRVATGLGTALGLRRIGNRLQLLLDASNGSGVETVMPALAENFGSGCPGTGGNTPAAAVSAPPRIGGFPILVRVAAARPSAACLVGFAASRADLPLGGGCTVYPALPFTGVGSVTNGHGDGLIAVPIPNQPDLLGAELFAQWFIADPAGSFGPGLGAFSDGLRLVLGDS